MQPPQSPQWSYPSPAPPKRMGTGTLVGIIVAIVLIVVVAGVAIVALENATHPPAQQTPPVYSATMVADSSATYTTYSGQVPVNNEFLLLNATVYDTGNVALSPSYSDWSIVDSLGFPEASADQLFYGSVTIPAIGSLHVNLVFDLRGFSVPTKLVLSLPNGAQAAASLPPLIYSATLNVDSYAAVATYEGKTPTGAYFLVVNVTIQDTGNAVLTPSYLDWTIADVNGNFEAFAEQSFYGIVAVQPHSSLKLTVVFDLTTYDNPAKVIVDLPDGSHLVAVL